jgi:hypothetical protein
MDKFLQACRGKPTDAVAAGFFLAMTLAMVGLDATLGAACMAFIAGIYLQRLGERREEL